MAACLRIKFAPPRSRVRTRLTRALRRWRMRRKAAPDAVQPVVSLASAYVRQGKAEKAVSLLQEINKKYPTNAQVLVLLGQAKIAQKKDEEASQSFKEAIAQQPKDPIGYSALADLYIRQKNFDAAGNTLQAALKEMPDDVSTPPRHMPGLQILKGDQNAAITQYEAILKDQPTLWWRSIISSVCCSIIVRQSES